MSPSKLSLHCILDGPDSALLQAGLAACKWVGNAPSIVRDGFLSIFRWREPFDVVNDWMPHKTPEQAAEDWVNLQWHAIQGLDPAVYVEGPNEPTCKSAAQAAWLGRFELRRMQIMLERGHPRCVIFNFSTGTPSLPVHDADGAAIWTALLPALAHARANGHLLGLHEYGYKWDGWNLGRYRKVYAWLSALARPGLVITEAGADGSVGPWKDNRYHVVFGEKTQAYLAQLRAYDRETRKDPYVRAVFIYTKGTGGDAAWEPFNVGGQPEFINGLAQYIASQRDVQDEPGDPGSGGGDMAKFKAGDRVQTTRNTPILNALGATLGSDLPAGTVATVRSGPHGVQNSSGTFWLLDLPDREDGYANENRLQLWVESNPPGEQGGRDIDVRLAHHDGAGHHIYSTPGLDQGYLQKGDGHDAVLEWQGGGFAHAVGYSWNDRVKTWVFQIERNPGSLWGGAAQFGYVEYVKNGGQPNQMNRLEVAVRDGQPVPNFDVPPSSQPPTPPPPEPPSQPPPVETPDNELVVNPFFERDTWQTLPGGNQQPRGWTLAITPNGQPNIWPTHLQQGNTIPSVAQVVPECVHKTPGQLPPNEQAGQPRALLLPGAQTVYKLFGKDAWSATLSQVLRGTPGRLAAVEAWVLGETPDKPTASDGKLEPDHFRARLRLGGDVDEDKYLTMNIQRNAPSNERAWRLFLTDAVFPASGELLLALDFQQQWPGVVNFFIGPVTAVYVDDVPPPPPPPPPGDLPDLEPELSRIRSARDVFNAILDEQLALIEQKTQGD